LGQPCVEGVEYEEDKIFAHLLPHRREGRSNVKKAKKDRDRSPRRHAWRAFWLIGPGEVVSLIGTWTGENKKAIDHVLGRIIYDGHRVDGGGYDSDPCLWDFFFSHTHSLSFSSMIDGSVVLGMDGCVDRCMYRERYGCKCN
jgi:hypothetical protein